MIGQKGTNFIIEGNIGSGKSTFLNKLSTLPVETTLIPEQIGLWTDYKGINYLQHFYDNPRKWTYHFQTLAINTSANEYKKFEQKDGLKFFERSIYSPLKVFGKQQNKVGAYCDDEYELQKKLTDDIISWINYDIKGIIYVRTSPDVAQKRVISRSRKEDSTIPLDYLKALHELHDEWLFNESKLPVLIFENDSSVIINDFDKIQADIFEWIQNPQGIKIIDPNNY